MQKKKKQKKLFFALAEFVCRKEKAFFLVAKPVLQWAEVFFFLSNGAQAKTGTKNSLKVLKNKVYCSSVRKIWKNAGKSSRWWIRECDSKTRWWDYESGGGCVGNIVRLSDDEGDKLDAMLERENRKTFPLLQIACSLGMKFVVFLFF